MAGVYWFRIVEGEDFIRRVTYFGADGVTPVDLTGYSAQFDIDIRGNPIISVTSGHGVTLGGADGTIDIKVPASTIAAAQDFSSAQYRLLLTDLTGSVSCLLHGLFSKEGHA